MRPRCLWLLIPLLISCSGSRTLISQKLLSHQPTAIEATGNQVNAVVLFDSAQVEIFGDGPTAGSTFTRHRAIQVLTRSGLRHASAAIPLSANATLEALQARCITADGRVIDLLPEEVFEVDAYPQFIFYSDRKSKIFAFPGVETGAILEYAYTLTIHDHTLWSSWAFQDDIPVMLSKFTIIAPSQWEIRSKIYAQGHPVSYALDKGGPGFKSKHSWSARHLPARVVEPGMPSWRESTAWLSIAPLGIENWRDVSRWYHNLSSEQSHATPQIDALVKQIAPEKYSPREKLERIYNWVRDEIRYVAVAIGIGQYQPHSAATTLRRRYGDCKDMTTLLIALAGAAGIELRSALISTTPNGPVDSTLATPWVFNHAIAYAPEFNLFMDATAKGCPFGVLPWWDSNRQVLVAGLENQAPLRQTPTDSTVNKWERAYSMQLDRDESLSGTLSSKWRGQPAFAMAPELLNATTEDICQWIHITLLPPGAHLDTASVMITGLNHPTDQISMAARFTLPQAGRIAGSTVTLPLHQWPLDRHGLLNLAAKRCHPYIIPYVGDVTTELYVAFPPALSPLDTAGFENKTTGPQASHLFKYSTGEESVFLSQTWQNRSTAIDAGDWSAYQRFLQKSHQCIPLSITFKKEGNHVTEHP